MIRPNLMIIGTQKSGTTSLFDWLALSGQVHAPPEAKDYPYFSREHVFADKDRYTQAFADAGPDTRWLAGAEANLSYSAAGLERLAREAGNARLVMLVRHPVARTFSAWRYGCERGLETRSFEDAIAQELAGDIFAPDSFEGLQMNYLGHSDYAAQAGQVFEHFDESALTILEYKEFFGSVAARAKFLQDFGITDLAEVEIPRSNTTAGGFRSAALNRFFIRDRARQGFVDRMARALMPPRLRRAIRFGIRELNRAPAPVPELTADMRAKLLEHFAPRIAAFEQLAGRKFPDWYE